MGVDGPGTAQALREDYWLRPSLIFVRLVRNVNAVPGKTEPRDCQA